MATTRSQANFKWSGKDKSGNLKSGDIKASNMAEARSIIRARGIALTKIKKQAKPLFAKNAKITAADIALVTRQIATMLNAGVTLIQSVNMISTGHGNPAVRELLNEIEVEVKAGSPLSSTLRKHPLYFDDLYCDLVHTGEQSGSLELIFDRIAIYKEKAEALKSKIKKAMFYPIAVLVIAIVVTSILLIFVVPQFEEIFSSFGAQLPAFTLLVIGISNSLQEYGVFIGAGLGIFGYLFGRAYKRSKALRDKVDAYTLRIPVIGEILKKASIARFARTLSTTFAAGVPLIGALDSAAGASGNAVYRDAILYVKKEVAGGLQMNTAMRATEVFPDMVSQMVSIGEEAGSVDEMLDKIAVIYEREVDDLVDGLTSLLEPMIMAVLGVVIGGLIIAMYLPIFEMGNVV